MDSHTNELLIGHIALLMTTLVGIFYQVYRENRNHRWQVEDRRERVAAHGDIAARVDAVADRVPLGFIRRSDVAQLIGQRHDTLTASLPASTVADRRHSLPEVKAPVGSETRK